MVVMGLVPRRGNHGLSSVCITWPWLMWTSVLHSMCDHYEYYAWEACLSVECVYVCVCVCLWMCVCVCVCVCVYVRGREAWCPCLVTSHPVFVSFLSEAVPVLWIRDPVANKEDTVLAVTHQGGRCSLEYHTNECLNWGLRGKQGWAIPSSGQVMPSFWGWRKRSIWGIKRKLVWMEFRGQGDSC